MGNFLQAIGRAQPATQIRQALRDRSQDMRDNVRLGLEQRRTDAYIQSQENSAKMQAEQLKTLENKNLKDREEREKGDVNIPTESLTSMLKYPDEQGPTIIEMAENNGWIGKNPDGSKYIKRRNLADFDAARKDPTFAVKFANDRLSISREKLKEFDASVKEKTKDGKVLNPQQKQKNAESRAILLKDLEESQALSGTFEKIAEHKRKQDELAIKQKSQAETERHNKVVENKGSTTDTRTKLAKLIDERNNLPDGSPSMAYYDSAIQKESTRTGMRVTVDKDGNVTLEQGVEGGGIEKSTRGSLEKEIITLETNLADLKAIGSSFSKSYLTYQGKIARWTLKELDKMNVDVGKGGKEFISGARMFTENVEQVFNTYRKLITGAQAAIKEIEMLRESILNKKLTPSELDASYNRYVNQIERQVALKRMMLSGNMDERNIGPMIDSIVVSERSATTKAPIAALSALFKDPSLKSQFKQKYGYVPEGM